MDKAGSICPPGFSRASGPNPTPTPNHELPNRLCVREFVGRYVPAFGPIQIFEKSTSFFPEGGGADCGDEICGEAGADCGDETCGEAGADCGDETCGEADAD